MDRSAWNRYPKRLDHVVWKIVDGKGIVLDLESGAYFEFSPIAMEIWKRCDGHSAMTQIVEDVAREFEADVRRVREDFSDFIGELKRNRLVSLGDEAGPVTR